MSARKPKARKTPLSHQFNIEDTTMADRLNAKQPQPLNEDDSKYESHPTYQSANIRMRNAAALNNTTYLTPHVTSTFHNGTTTLNSLSLDQQTLDMAHGSMMDNTPEVSPFDVGMVPNRIPSYLSEELMPLMHSGQQQAHQFEDINENSNHPLYLSKLERLQQSIANTVISPIPITKSFRLNTCIAQLQPSRFISTADLHCVPKELLSLSKEQLHLLPTTSHVFTRQSCLSLYQQSADYQRYNNFNHPQGYNSKNSFNPQYSFSLLAAYNNRKNLINPGKFIILGHSWLQPTITRSAYSHPYYLHKRFHTTKFYQPIFPHTTTTSNSMFESSEYDHYEPLMRRSFSHQFEEHNFQPFGDTPNHLQDDIVISHNRDEIAPEASPQQMLYREYIVKSLLQEIRSFSRSKLPHKNILTTSMSLFQHHTWATQSKTPDMVSNQTMKNVSKYSKTTSSAFDQLPHYCEQLCAQSLSFYTPSLLYTTVGDYTLSPGERLSLMTKLFHNTVSRIVLNSYIEYETNLAKELKQQSEQEEKNYQEEISIQKTPVNHFVRYYEDEDDGKTPESCDYSQRQHQQVVPSSTRSLFAPEKVTNFVASIPTTDLQNQTIFSSTLQWSKMLYNHFKSNILTDYRMGMDIRYTHRQYTNTLSSHGMDSSTQFIPFTILLHIGRKHLFYCTPTQPMVYMSLPIEYLLAMQKLDNPLSFPPAHNTNTADKHDQGEDLSPYSSFSTDDAELIYMKSHHIIEDINQIALPNNRPRTKYEDPKHYDVTWRTSVSPLHHFILKTRRLQHQAYSKSLRSGTKREQQHNFLVLRTKYAMILYNFMKEFNIYDNRLYPDQFLTDLKAAKSKLNHVSLSDILGVIHYDGYRSTSKGLVYPQYRKLYHFYGSTLWSTHTAYNYYQQQHYPTTTTTTTTNAITNKSSARVSSAQPHQYYHQFYTIPTPSGCANFVTRHDVNTTISSIIPHVSTQAATALANQLEPPPPASSPHEKFNMHQHHRRRSSFSGISDYVFSVSERNKSDALTHFFRSNRHFLYSHLFPNYPTTDVKFNNIGRCHSLLIAMNSYYVQTHALPRFIFNPTDYRLRPASLLNQIRIMRGMLRPAWGDLTKHWNTLWNETLPEQRFKRRVLANCIADGTYLNGPQHCSVAYSSFDKLPRSGKSTVKNENDPHAPNYVRIEEWKDDPNSQWSASTSTKRDVSNVEPLPQGVMIEQDILLSPNPTISPIKKSMLINAKKKLRRIYENINIYKGDTINQHCIMGLFGLIGETNWTFHGNQNLLVPTKPYTQSTFGSFFSGLFD